MRSDQVDVVFRVWRDDDAVIALFPGEAFDVRGLQCMSYMHAGQHSGADYRHCIAATRPAFPQEYDALKRELEGLGYDMRVIVRASGRTQLTR